MSSDDMIAAMSLAFESTLTKMGFKQTKDAPTPPPTLNAAQDLAAKRAANLAKAREAKAAKAAAAAPVKRARNVKVAPVQVAAAVKPQIQTKTYTTSKGVKGQLVMFGCFSTFVADGDDEKAQTVFDTINMIRGDSTPVIAALRQIGCNV